MITVYYYSSILSGGPLSDEDWRALHAAGWELARSYSDPLHIKDPWGLDPTAEGNVRSLGAITWKARKVFPTLRAGIEEWQECTGKNPAELECPCYSPLHEFHGEDSEGNHIDGPSIVSTHTLDWG